MKLKENDLTAATKMHNVPFSLSWLITNGAQFLANLLNLAQWFPMCQFRFENYHTKIRVQIQNFYEIIHLQLFSSHCPDFQPFWAISGIFVDFCRLVPYDFVGIQSPKTMWGLSRPAKFITWKSCVLVSYWNPESFRKNQEGP